MQHTPTQNRFLSSLKDRISKEETPFLYVVKGNAGTGKTTVSHSLHENFNKVVYLFESSNSIKTIINKPNLKDFKTFIFRNGRKGNALGEDMLATILFIVALVPISYQLIYLMIIESRIFFRRRSGKRSIRSLYEDEEQANFYITLRWLLWLRKIYSNIGQFYNQKIKRRKDYKSQIQNILIFDEINFYDDKNIEYIKTLHFAPSLQKVAPAFKDLGIIINYCPDYHTSSKLKELFEICKTENNFELPTYSNEDITFLCSEYGDETTNLVKNSLSKIKNISLHSNLALTNSLIRYIYDHKDINGFELEFQKNYEILRKYYDNENGLKETLQLLSLTQDDTLVQEIVELTKLMSYDQKMYDAAIRNTIFKASKKKFINPKDIQIIVPDRVKLSFVENQFRDYFKPKDVNFINKFYQQYAEVMKILNPGDYSEREHYYLLCGDSEKAELFRFMNFAQACYTDTVNEIGTIELKRYAEFGNYLKEAYNIYYRGRFNELPYLFDKMNLCKVDKLARFEQDLLKCKAMLVSADKSRIDEVEKIMQNYIESIDEAEKEIMVRIKLVSLIVELYNGRNEEVKKMTRQIIAESETLSRIDGRYDYHQYSVRRRAIISNEIEIAHVETQKSTNYFYIQTQKSNSVFFRREYFCSLINLSATFRYQGDYINAYEQSLRALAIYDKYPHDFPRVTLYNALATTGFECGKLSDQEAIECYLRPMENDINIYKSRESTDYFILNNIACIKAFSDLDVAYKYIEKGICILNNCSDSIDSHKYRLFTNKAVLLYLKGNAEKALETIREVKNLQTFAYSDSYHLGRYNALINIFSNQQVTSVSELDILMEKENPSKNNIEKHYNKSLHLWSLQYWSR